MPTTSLRSVLQAALSVTRPGGSLRTDAELLAAFAAARDEAAFAEVVRRHGRLVRGTARRMAGDASLAEDVFQATFLLLAHKASTISWGPTVGPWLYQAARRLGAKARTLAARRPSLTPLAADVAAPTSDPSAGLAWTEVRTALDHALAALPAHLRDPLVLCYLEGLTQDEAAAALGCSSTTVKGRVTRGRERLRRLLQRRGLSLSAALAVPLVGELAVTADAAAATARTATAFRATGVAPPAVRELLRGTPLGMKLVAGMIALVLACAAGVVGLAAGRSTTDPVQPPGEPVRADAPKPAKPATDAFGDPLPDGAVARLGSVRLKGTAEPSGALFSPDGTKVASWNYYGLTVYDAATGRQLLERREYWSAGNAIGWRTDGTGVAVVVLPDQSYFVSAFTDLKEKRPTPPAAKLGATPIPHIHYFALSPDATRLAVVSNPDTDTFTIDLLPATPGQPLAALKAERTLGPFPGPCRDIRYTADGLLATLHGPWEEKADWSVAVIDPDKKKVIRTARIPAPGFCPWQFMLSLSADGRLAASAPRTKIEPNSHDGTLRVWDLEADKELCSVAFPQRGYGTGHTFTPDGKRLIASMGTPYFQVWDTATGKETAQAPASALTRFRTEAAAVAVSPDGKRFTTARRDGRIDIWDTATGKALIPLATHRDTIDSVAVSPDGTRAATLGYDESIRVWELATGKLGCTLSAPRGNDPAGRDWTKRRLLFTPGGALLFAAAGELMSADSATGKPLDLPAGLRGWKGYVGGFAADGKTLATFADDTVTLWDWPAGTVRATVTVPLAPGKAPVPRKGPEVVGVNALTLSPDGRFLFTNSYRWEKEDPPAGAYQNGNDVWDARTGKHVYQLTTFRIEHPPAAFSPDSRVLYLGGHPSGDGKRTDALTAWDRAAGTLLRRFADPNPVGQSRKDDRYGRAAEPVALSPDGRLLAAAESGMGADGGI